MSTPEANKVLQFARLATCAAGPWNRDLDGAPTPPPCHCEHCVAADIARIDH